MNEETGARDTATLARTIETDIYRGTLAPGMWLKQIDLEERYGCTRIALRHALEALQSRKLVQRVRNRGYYVPSMDDALVRDIMDARAKVETSIADELVANVTDGMLARLSYLATIFADTVKTGTIREQDEANHAFHRELLKACHNQVIIEIIWDLRWRIPISVQRANNTPARMDRSAHEHFEMVEALRLRDAGMLRDVTARHVTLQDRGA